MLEHHILNQKNGKYVITHTFKKKTQKMPKIELEKALKRRKSYEEEHGEEKHE